MNENIYHTRVQKEGKRAHESIDQKKYSTKKNVLQGISVFSDRYQLMGKIDIFNEDTGILIERKREVKTIYDGYIFQLYGQYFAMNEMGYKIKALAIYCLKHNKTYDIHLPEEDKLMFAKFESTLDSMRNFHPHSYIQSNENKCRNCIYRHLCGEVSLC